jgi:hypothetical protein
MFFLSEGYGGVLDEFKVDAEIDLPGVEFWNHGLYKSHGIVPSVAHTMGKPIVLAEAFTSRPPDKSKWIETPAALKVLGDTSYCMGVNRFAIHSYIHQPRSDIAPGFTHGRYGTQFGRLNSWWPLANGWIDYLRRCQFLLQHGAPVVDLLYLTPETLRTEERDLNFPWPKGYKGNFLSTAQLSLATVKDGMIRIKGPTQYRAMILPKRWPASIEALAELKRLAGAGATILGPSNVIREGVNDFRRDAQWQADAKWITSLPAASSLPDFPADFETPAPLQFVHRAGEDFDLYFVSNPTDQKIETDAALRVTGREPEVWNPVTGTQLPATQFKIESTHTRVHLALEPTDSVFVVFRHPASVQEKAAPPATAEESIAINGPWQVAFQPNRGAPASITLDKLISLTEHTDPGVKYFSGLATYTHEINLPEGARQCRLNLGSVYDLAEVRVNDQRIGILWKPPFVINLTPQVSSGRNSLTIVVANRWINRLIGDEQLPPDAEYVSTGITPGALVRFPDWWNQSPLVRQRVAFSVWKHYDATSPLVPSGLVGPVRLVVVR